MIVYVWGNLTAANFTPRPGKDTIGGPGRKPGLSASVAIPHGKKAQGIDTDKLKPPLQAFADDPDQGGTPGNFAIAPADARGDVDVESLMGWAMSRNTGQTHEFTQIALDAVIAPNVRGNAP